MGRTFTLTQTDQNIVNAYDYLGMLVGLLRLPGEKNTDYRKRLWDVYVHRASASQTGLINGITRELGLKPYNAITITYNGPTTLSPRVVVTDTLVYLYSNWTLIDESIDANVLYREAIDIFTEGGDAYYLCGLVETINNIDPSAAYFIASIENGVDEFAPSASIFGQDSRIWVDSEQLKQVHRNKLAHTNIVPGSVTFPPASASTYTNHRATENDVITDGDYYIDYTNGIIYSYLAAPTNAFCRYMYDTIPITLQASPVILHEFGSTEVQDKIFECVLQADGTYVGALPTSTAIDYINELLATHKMYWGE